MIRHFNSRDMDKVLDIWLRASVKAHNFVDGKFWEARLEDIRDMYIPDSETFVYDVDTYTGHKEFFMEYARD